MHIRSRNLPVSYKENQPKSALKSEHCFFSPLMLFSGWYPVSICFIRKWLFLTKISSWFQASFREPQTNGGKSMTIATSCFVSPQNLWSASSTLSPRVESLRREFWSFYEREYTNEVRAYTTGTPWDTMYSIWNWTNVPEMALFQKGFRSYLSASARPVELPTGFWNEPLVIRQALFFRQVIRSYLPVEILEGELIVGSHFNTALSRCLKKDEARRRDREEQTFLKVWNGLNSVGVGNCAAVPGHLVPNYPKILKIGWKGIWDEAQVLFNDPGSTVEQKNMARAIMISAEATRDLADRYAVRADHLAANETDQTAPGRVAGNRPHLPKGPLAAPRNLFRSPASPLVHPHAGHGRRKLSGARPVAGTGGSVPLPIFPGRSGGGPPYRRVRSRMAAMLVDQT